MTPSWLRNELRNCYDKYSNDLHYIDTRLINVAYIKFVNFWVHSITNYWWMSKWCVSFLLGIFYMYSAKYDTHYQYCSLYPSCYSDTNVGYSQIKMYASKRRKMDWKIEMWTGSSALKVLPTTFPGSSVLF